MIDKFISAAVHDDLNGRFVASVCPQCGGWTMFHAEPTRSDVKDETEAERRHGNLIVYFKNPISLGPACNQAERRVAVRTCDQ